MARNSNLTLDEEQLGSRYRVTIIGEVELSSAPSLAHRLDELIRAGHRDLELDLERVSFIDSSGPSVLVGIRRKLNRESDSLVLKQVPKPVMGVFEITGLLRVFDFA